VQAGRPQVATAPFAEFSAWASRSGAPAWAALRARCRGQLSAGGDALDAFHAALVLHGRGSSPLERARTELAFGSALRRARRRREARGHLRAALQTFEEAGAAPWADRARRELRSTGDIARRRVSTRLDDLTAQELQVSRLVAEGATNREVAAQLFLGPRTIDAHVRSVFGKLGIKSHTELVRLFGAGAGYDAPAPRTSSL
jgi:DNA-binding CsgD family transcriptional regulator